jgi:triphosphoribosyl-dephospho-CoA synthase
MLPIGLCAQIACLWETTARNPGNCHRFRDFDDATYLDFLLGAAAVAPMLEMARQRPVGLTVLEGVQATRRVVRVNTNLGILLLLAPLAAVPEDEELRAGVGRVLDGLTVEDARAVYQAIRLASPAGLGQVSDQDIRGEPTQTLRRVMALAAHRDLVARQYAHGFCEVFDDGVPTLLQQMDQRSSVEEALIYSHLHLMATYPDSLIARKKGMAEAEEAARRARRVLYEGWPHTAAGQAALEELDAWLRGDERGRNPGTTSDLATACLFVALRQDMLMLPSPLPWSRPGSPNHE